MREWIDNLNITDSGINAVHDIHRWTCQCIKFKHSTFFICNHLIQACNLKPKYYSDIVVRDYPPFVEDARNNGIQQSSIEIQTYEPGALLDINTPDKNTSKKVY